MKKILCIDIGNTNVVIGLSTEDKSDFQFKHFRITTNHNITVDEVSITVWNILNLLGEKTENISKVLISSVVPEVDVQFRLGIERILGIVPKFITTNDIPMEIDYLNRNEIGSDRIVVSFASRELYSLDSVIVDTGTATTVDFVSNGKYLGGAILPGINTSLYAMFQKASKIPKISLETPKNVIGKTTEECIRSGMIIGFAKAIEGIIVEGLKEIGKENPKIIFTGGLSDRIFPFVNLPNKIIDKDLLLKGLKLLS